ncbi:MAG: mechanosensitive ion channel family protein [Devosia sp.]
MNLPFVPPAWLSVILPIAGAIVVVALGWILSRLAQRAIVHWVPRAGGGALTIAPLAGQAARYAILVVAIVTALSFVGVPTASILTVLGAASLAIALALQGTLSNIAAGIMLAWLRPISVGDYVVGDGVEGIVVEIGLFGTRLRSSSGLFVFTNNNRLWNGAITNHTREPRRRVNIKVTIPDTADLQRARETLLGLAAADTRVLRNVAPSVFVDSFGTNTVTLEMRVWVATPDYRDALRGLTEAAKFAINRMLAQGTGGVAEVKQAADPHGGHEPDGDQPPAMPDTAPPRAEGP